MREGGLVMLIETNKSRQKWLIFGVFTCSILLPGYSPLFTTLSANSG
jgi:hypothetical protein